jgi:catechol 2,3-dioxygenase-like lactoylglutathione lyase family enzyme
MITGIAHVTIVVDDCAKALEFYTKKMGFVKRHDQMVDDFRWVTVSPADAEYPQIVLHQPTIGSYGSKEEVDAMLDLVGANAPMTLIADDCKKTFQELSKKGVVFSQEPTQQDWGVEAVFEDLYGNPFFLLEPAEQEDDGVDEEDDE